LALATRQSLKPNTTTHRSNFGAIGDKAVTKAIQARCGTCRAEKLGAIGAKRVPRLSQKQPRQGVVLAGGKELCVV